MSEQNQSEQNQPDQTQPDQNQAEQSKGDQDNAPKGTPDLEDDTARLAAEVQEARANNRRGTVGGGKGRLLAGTALGGACALFIAVMFWPQADLAAQATLPTGQPAAFQTNEEPFARMPLPARREPEPNPRMLAQIEALEAEIERLRQQPQQDVEITVEDDVPPVEDAPVVSNDPQIDSLLAQVSQLQDTMTSMQFENANMIADRDRQLAQLQAQLDAARITSGNPDLGMVDGEVDRRREAEELYRARAASPIIAFGGGASGGGGAAGVPGAMEAAAAMPGMEGLDPNLRNQSQNERFARQQAARAPVERAKVIASPANTVLQGTMIQAVLETAINTDLPGAIRALVSEDVHSYDGSRILIPRGSRVIGAYNDNTDLGQRRAMIVWNRIILPDNQTVEIGAYGGDAIGRSGLGGVVNTHFGARFGSAALISLIGLAPAIAVADDDDDSTSDVAEAMSQNMMEATSSALDGYLNRQPTIAIKQGSLVTIMVDRDLEIL
ncbi:TrbI/VirB10 family protein [Paracoccus sp. WLY502]|uniref:TrbI/VirB10 family protein n=1 Tax=Paracoccus yibinensis TaxID=3068891 RepID=UPI0027964075|nr:TrbI/VirB10 family protein [Paracoccus sp. WLY502]MDQ1902189.1 TrbI/VirB10 family protein [Paracoccus sp. WLY502]